MYIKEAAAELWLPPVRIGERSADQRVDQKDADESIEFRVNQRSTCNVGAGETATESLKGQVGPSCTTLRNVTSVLVRFGMSAVRVALQEGWDPKLSLNFG